jgi:HAD superfamily hydrolase (TIGR01450 family)
VGLLFFSKSKATPPIVPSRIKKIDRIRHFALDLDGTLYLGVRLFPCTRPFLDQLQELGLGRTFFTNNSSRSTRQYITKLNDLGIDATASDLFSSTHCTLGFLKNERPDIRRLYVLGTPALRGEFVEHGYVEVGETAGATDEPDAVIVGFDTTLSYERVCRAAWWISRGKAFIATHPDRVCPTNEPTVLVDCGAICRMLASATGREPDIVLGKPDPRMLKGVMDRHQLLPQELAVVGDRIYTDMAMAQGAGAMSILVLSGEATSQDVEKAPHPPDLVVENVGELGRMLSQISSAVVQ